MEIPAIDVHALAERLEAGDPVVDVRQPDEYATAHVPGVTLIPLDELEARVDDVPSSGTVYVICKSGGRSAKAVEFLRSRGVDAVNVSGGTSGWIDAGFRTDSGPN